MWNDANKDVQPCRTLLPVEVNTCSLIAAKVVCNFGEGRDSHPASQLVASTFNGKEQGNNSKNNIELIRRTPSSAGTSRGFFCFIYHLVRHRGDSAPWWQHDRMRVVAGPWLSGRGWSTGVGGLGHHPLQDAGVFPASGDQVTVVVQKGNVGHVTAVTTVLVARSLEGKGKTMNKMNLSHTHREKNKSVISHILILYKNIKKYSLEEILDVLRLLQIRRKCAIKYAHYSRKPALCEVN